MIHRLFQDLAICNKETIDINSGTSFASLLGVAHQSNYLWIDGIATNGSKYVYSNKPSKYISNCVATSEGYTQTEYTYSGKGEIKSLGYDSNQPFINYPKEVITNTSFDTYYTDGTSYSSSATASTTLPIYTRIGASGSAEYGVYYMGSTNAWTVARGVRLCYRPL